VRLIPEMIEWHGYKISILKCNRDYLIPFCRIQKEKSYFFKV